MDFNQIIFILFILGMLGCSITAFVVYQNSKKRYKCTEDGCKMNSSGKYSTKESCDKDCSIKPVTNNSLKNYYSTHNKMNDEIKDEINNETKDEINNETKDEINNETNNETNNEKIIVVEIPLKYVNVESNIQDIFQGKDELIFQEKDEDIFQKDNFDINYININNVREQIKRKKQSKPYYATTRQSSAVITDYDTFPYPRYFRGIPQSYSPIVAEREAGWRPRHDDAYAAKVDLDLKPDCVIPDLDEQVENSCKSVESSTCN